MYALMVTIPMKGSDDDLRPLLSSYSKSLVTCPGYVDHLWLRDRGEIGLLQIFEDEAALERHVRSRLLATLTAHPACGGSLFARTYRVFEFSEREGEEPTSLAGQAMAVTTAVARKTAD